MGTWLQPIRLTACIAVLPLASVDADVSIDVSLPPRSEHVEALLEIEPARARDQIGDALRSGYRPGRPGVWGSSQDEPFAEWLTLWRWFDLLARDEAGELLRFMKQHLFLQEQKGGEPKYVLRPPGGAVEPDFLPAPAEQVASSVNNPGQRRQLIEMLLPEDYTPVGRNLAAIASADLIAWMLANPEFSRHFFDVLADADFTPMVLERLRQLREADPEKFEKYPNLALALAVVYDQNPPPDWPHHQVDQALIPSQSGGVTDRFAFWVEAAEGRRLMTDFSDLGADHLKFVVDGLVADEELRWAAENVRAPRSNFGRVFSSIDYDTARLETRQYDWPHDSYTLETIEERGGICVDQAYFAMLAGKAKGLPTLYFVGQGANGGHAWFGYLKGMDRWELDCGRYETQNYVVGEAQDPQIWQPISDHELQFLALRFRNTPEFRASARDIVMADAFLDAGDPAAANAAADSALAVCPDNPAAWDVKARTLRASGAAPAAMAEHFHQAARQFPAHRGLRFGYQRERIGVLRKMGQTEEADRLERRMLAANRRTRSDLSVVAGAERLFQLVDQGDMDGAVAEYRTVMSRLSRDGGGNLFYEVVYPLTLSLLEAGDRRGAQRVVDLARRGLRPKRDGILDQELSDLAAEVKAARQNP